MATIKTEQLVGIDSAAQELLRYAQPAQTALKFRKALRPLQLDLKDFQVEYQRLLDRYSERQEDGQIVRDAEGAPVLTDREAFNTEATALLSASEEYTPFPIEDIKVIEQLRPLVLLQLGEFLAGPTEPKAGELSTIRTGEIGAMAQGLRLLANREMPFKKAKKVWRIYRQLQDISERATKEREALLDQYAVRNADGERVFLDKARERLDVADAFYAEEQTFLDQELSIEGIPLAWYQEVEKQHGNLPGEIAALLGDLVLLPPDAEPSNSNGEIENDD